MSLRGKQTIENFPPGAFGEDFDAAYPEPERCLDCGEELGEYGDCPRCYGGEEEIADEG